MAVLCYHLWCIVLLGVVLIILNTVNCHNKVKTQGESTFIRSIDKQQRNLLNRRQHTTSPLRHFPLKSDPNHFTQTKNDRKPADLYKWPWRNYEEWKETQQRLEDEIDQKILKYGGNRLPQLLTQAPTNPSKTDEIRPFRKLRKRKLRKNKTRKKRKRRKKLNMRSNSTFIPNKKMVYDVSSDGGTVLSVKYYSSNEDSHVTEAKADFTTLKPDSPNIRTTSYILIENFTQPDEGNQEEVDLPQRSSFRAPLQHTVLFRPKVRQGDNECLINNGGCEGLCVKTKSSYFCHCPAGFRLESSGKKCIDINECLTRNGHGPCQGECLNEWGSFRCGCSTVDGTELSEDGRTCKLLDKCAEETCSHICINTRSGAFCSCPEGYVLDADWKTCKDVDECGLTENQMDCNGGCINTIGSYICS